MGGGNGCWECNGASHEQQLTDCHCNCHADEQMEVDTPQDQPIAENQLNSGTRSDYIVRIGEHSRRMRRSSQVLALPAQDDVAPPPSAIQQPERDSSSTSSEYGFSLFPFHPFALFKVHLKMKHKNKHGRFHGHGHGHEQGRGQGHGHGNGYGHEEHLLRLPHHHGKHSHQHKKSRMLKLKIRHGRHFAPQPNLQELLTCGRRAVSVPP